MAYQYNKLWAALAQRNISKSQLRDALGLSSATLAKLSNNKIVSLDILEKICKLLNCRIEDVVTYEDDSISDFFDNIKEYFEECGYTLYSKQWPAFRFHLNDKQVSFLLSQKNFMEKQIIMWEYEANEKYFPNAGIINSTHYNLTNGILTVQGSFAVVELFILWLINHTATE